MLEYVFSKVASTVVHRSLHSSATLIFPIGCQILLVSDFQKQLWIWSKENKNKNEVDFVFCTSFISFELLLFKMRLVQTNRKVYF